jgi:hypothetical protein
VPVDVLDDHDRVVDEHAERDHQAEEHHHVQGETERLEHQEARQHRERDARGDEHRVAHTHEVHDHDDDEDQRRDDVVLQVGDRDLDALGLVAEHPVVHAGRPGGLLLGGERFDGLRDLQDVRPRAFGDRQRHGGLPVQSGIGLALRDPVDHPGHVAHEHRSVAHAFDGDRFDLGGVLELTGHPHQGGGVTGSDRATWDVHVLVGDGARHVVQGEPVV